MENRKKALKITIITCALVFMISIVFLYSMSNSIMVYAIENNNIRLVKLATTFGADTFKIRIQDYSPIEIAAQNENAAMVKALLKKTTPQKSIYKALIESIRNGNEEIIKILLESDFNLNVVYNLIPMSEVIYKTDPEDSTRYDSKKAIDILKLLIDFGGDVNFYDPGHRYPPLIVAVEVCDNDIVSFLVKNGADVNIDMGFEYWNNVKTKSLPIAKFKNQYRACGDVITTLENAGAVD